MGGPDIVRCLVHVQICICRKEGQWQCGLVSKKYLEPNCDTDTSKYEGAFDAFEIVPDTISTTIREASFSITISITN